MKVRSEFLAWLKMESARRGLFLSDLVEDLVARSYAGKKVWRLR